MECNEKSKGKLCSCGAGLGVRDVEGEGFLFLRGGIVSVQGPHMVSGLRQRFESTEFHQRKEAGVPAGHQKMAAVSVMGRSREVSSPRVRHVQLPLHPPAPDIHGGRVKSSASVFGLWLVQMGFYQVTQRPQTATRARHHLPLEPQCSL